jgi:tetratricopeptide (TPR) repeat protein
LGCPKDPRAARSTSTDYESAKARLGALDASARLARKRGDRQEALEFHRLSIAELDDPKVKGYFEAGGATDEYDQILAVELTNRAILLGYEQKPTEARPLFERAYGILSKRPDAMALGFVDLLVAWADNRLDSGDPNDAARRLDEAIGLLQTKGGRPQVLARALQKRADIAIDRGDARKAAELLQQIEHLSSQLQSSPLEKAKIASTKAALLAKAGRPDAAIGQYEEALRNIRSVLPEASLDVANALAELSTAAANAGDIDRALKEARAADGAVSAWLTEESAGCRAGTAANRLLVAKIREWRGLMAILKRQALRKVNAGEDEFRKIDRDIFDLVQERELDRVGVAAERGILRGTSTESLRIYQRSLFELCAARSAFDESVKSGRTDLSAGVQRLNRARAQMSESEKALQPDVRLKFAIGHLKLTLEDLPSILHDREVLVAFRVGDSFSVVFIAARRGNAVVTATALSKTATQAEIAAAVTSVVGARTDGERFRGAVEKLGVVLGLGELRQVLDGAEHAFVVADGNLQLLPAHLLPIGSTPLGEIAPTSALSSLSMLAALRGIADDGQRSRSYSGFGAPLLDKDRCPSDQTTSDPRQLVECLDKAFGTDALLHAAAQIFGGSPQ